MNPINFNEEVTNIEIDYSGLVATKADSLVSPIDDFYMERDRALKISNNPIFEASSDNLQLLISFIFSSAEVYFRTIISKCIYICPVCSELSSSHVVPLGAASAYKRHDLGLAVKEATGLTSTGEIVKRTNNLLGIHIKPNSSIDLAIKKFDKACNLRHATVHTRGELLYANRSELGVHINGRCVINIDQRYFQVILQTVTNAIRAYNSFLPNAMLIRWFNNSNLTLNWTKDQKLVESLWKVFSSAIDGCPDKTAKEVYMAIRAERRSN